MIRSLSMRRYTARFVLSAALAITLVTLLATDAMAAGYGIFDQHSHQPDRSGRASSHVPTSNINKPPANAEGMRMLYSSSEPVELTDMEDATQEIDLKVELVDGKHPAVGRISANAQGNGMYHGSGTLVSVTEELGVVLTNWHVVRDAIGDVTVEFPDGFRSRGRVIMTDNVWDLAAVLIHRPKGIEPVAMADKIPGLGDLLVIAGYGSGKYRHSAGNMVHYYAPNKNEPEDILEISTGARFGDSGGPIFNADGLLAGVLFGSAEGLTNGSHVVRVQAFLDTATAMEPKLNERLESIPVPEASEEIDEEACDESLDETK